MLITVVVSKGDSSTCDNDALSFNDMKEDIGNSTNQMLQNHQLLELLFIEFFFKFCTISLLFSWLKY